MMTWLKRFLSLAAEGEDDQTTQPEPAEPTLDDFLDNAEVASGGKPQDAKPAEEETPAERRAREADERAARAETRAANAERLAQEAASRAVAPVSPAKDAEWDREERELAEARAAGKDTSWMQWKIQVDRDQRALKSQISQERMAATSERDLASFERMEITHPKLFARYKDRVNAAYEQAAKMGQTYPRMLLLDLFIGNDMRSGKLNVTRKAKPAAPAAETLSRGKPPGVRSDVTSKQRKDESQARRERLRDTYI